MLIVPLLFHADPTLRGSRRARSPRCILGLRTPLKVATPAADCASGGQWGSKNEEGALKTETRSEHALPKSSHPPSHPTCFQQLATLPLPSCLCVAVSSAWDALPFWRVRMHRNLCFTLVCAIVHTGINFQLFLIFPPEGRRAGGGRGVA